MFKKLLLGLCSLAIISHSPLLYAKDNTHNFYFVYAELWKVEDSTQTLVLKSNSEIREGTSMTFNAERDSVKISLKENKDASKKSELSRGVIATVNSSLAGKYEKKNIEIEDNKIINVIKNEDYLLNLRVIPKR